MSWKSYTTLAWTERILASPADYEKEVLMYVAAIRRHAGDRAKTMLHLGCGAGGHDLHFKKHFDLTGVDLSEDMLAMARDLNPEVQYFQGDMRTVRLETKFDTVVIPDSIMYMTTLEDLERAVRTAVLHLVPGGCLLVVAHPEESFRDNNFVYQGSDGDTRVTLFENNHVISENSYEAALVYLIRRKGELQIHHDIHRLGLFSNGEWLEVFEDSGLELEEAADMDDLYDDYLMDEGEYRLKVFICRKRGERP